jgi:hypothetical protein
MSLLTAELTIRPLNRSAVFLKERDIVLANENWRLTFFYMICMFAGSYKVQPQRPRDILVSLSETDPGQQYIGSSSYSNRRDQSGLNRCCTAMWKANGKTITLTLFLDSLLKNRYMYARCFLRNKIIRR